MSALLLPGCTGIMSHWRGEVGSGSAPQTRAKQPSETFPPGFGATTAPGQAAPPPASLKPGAESPAPTTRVTLGNADASRKQAEQLLEATDVKLASIDAAKLDAQDAATYQQASGFAASARKAMAEQDYVAATGFAQKASLLADKVAQSRSPR
jgi:hypothetical protein